MGGQRFQFRFRTLLLGVTLIGVGFGIVVWVTQSREWIRQRHAIIESPYSGFLVSRKPIRAPGGLWLFGESAFGAVDWYGHPDDLDRVKRLFPEAEVRLPQVAASATAR